MRKDTIRHIPASGLTASPTWETVSGVGSLSGSLSADGVAAAAAAGKRERGDGGLDVGTAMRMG